MGTMAEHVIKIGKYNTRKVCLRCGFMIPEDNSATMADHKKETGH